MCYALFPFLFIKTFRGTWPWSWPEIAIANSLSHHHYQSVKRRVCDLQITSSYERASAAAWVNTSNFHLWHDPGRTIDLFRIIWSMLWMRLVEIFWLALVRYATTIRYRNRMGASPPLSSASGYIPQQAAWGKCYRYYISHKTRSQSRSRSWSRNRPRARSRSRSRTGATEAPQLWLNNSDTSPVIE